MGPQPVAEEIHTSAGRQDAGLAELHAHLGQLVGESPADGQGLLAGAHDGDHVVHVAGVAPQAQLALGPLIDLVSHQVGQPLAGQVAHRDPYGVALVAPGRAVDDGVQQMERCRAAHLAANGFFRQAVADAREILAHVHLEHPAGAGGHHALEPLLHLVRAGVGALARPTGVGVVDHGAVPDRRAHPANRLLRYPVPVRGRQDLAPLGLVDLELPVPAGLIRAPQQLHLQRAQLLPQPVLEGGHLGLVALALAGQLVGGEEVLPVHHLADQAFVLLAHAPLSE